MTGRSVERVMQAAADAFDATSTVGTALRDTTGVKVGVDLGTAHIAVIALDADDRPLAGAYEPADVVQDGVVVDFLGASQTLRRLKERVEHRLGARLERAHGAFPPGVPEPEQRAVRHVIESVDLDCTGLVDEPSAANAVLQITDGAIVDVGGGTTGVAIVRGGRIVHTADEPTGGRHFTLVVAGGQGISLEEAEQRKRDPAHHRLLLPAVRPVMEKVAAIIRSAVVDHDVDSIHLLGGAAMFTGFAEVVEAFTGVTTRVPPHPLLVTPLGIARSAPGPARIPVLTPEPATEGVSHG